MIVDLYAGPGGWDEGMKMLGITNVVGIEWDHAACLTAVAAGHRRIRADVSKYCISVFAGAEGLIASPPCQAWSMAGKRQGEVDRAKVHELVDAYANGSNSPGDGWADERSHHAAQPVRWVRDLRPQWVALEQVPPVLGLWQHIAERMRRWGYSTWTGVLNSADYGVPQTRERAILIARLDGAALPPRPTHAREVGEPDLFGDQPLPWVSMAAALDWEAGARVHTSFGVPSGGSGTHVLSADAGPSHTVTTKARSWALRSGNQPNAAIRTMDEAAPTMAFGHNAARVEWLLRNGSQDNACTRAIDQPAGTLFFGKRANWVGWVHERPATTIQGDPRVGRPGHKDRAGGEAQFEQGSLKITQAEAAVLQSFRADYPWQGNKTKQFEQIGNAVPPQLAAHVIGALVGTQVPA